MGTVNLNVHDNKSLPLRVGFLTLMENISGTTWYICRCDCNEWISYTHYQIFSGERTACYRCLRKDGIAA